MEKNRMSRTALAVALASIALVVCGEAGAKPEASASGAEMSQEREQAQSRSRKITKQVDAGALIARAVQPLRPTYNGKTQDLLDFMVCKMGTNMSLRSEALQALRDQGVVIESGSGLDVIATGTDADNNAACLAWVFSAISRPMLGWPRPNAQPFSAEANAELARWGAIELAQAVAGGEVLADIAKKMDEMAGATTQELEEHARNVLLRNANEYREAFKSRAKPITEAAGSAVLDFAHPSAGPHFQLMGYDFQGGPSGAVVTRAGSTVFGNGYLDSARYSVEAAADSPASMTKRSGGSL